MKYRKPDEPIDIYIRTWNDHEKLFLSIRDTGMGIKKENLRKVFEKFYRTDASRSSETGGTGLGLAIAANIVKLHGGRIDCRSDKENGTSFIVSLPASLKVT